MCHLELFNDMEIKLDKEKNEYVRKIAEQKYEYGFTTDVETDVIPRV